MASITEIWTSTSHTPTVLDKLMNGVSATADFMFDVAPIVSESVLSTTIGQFLVGLGVLLFAVNWGGPMIRMGSAVFMGVLAGTADILKTMYKEGGAGVGKKLLAGAKELKNYGTDFVTGPGVKMMAIAAALAGAVFAAQWVSEGEGPVQAAVDTKSSFGRAAGTMWGIGQRVIFGPPEIQSLPMPPHMIEMLPPDHPYFRDNPDQRPTLAAP